MDGNEMELDPQPEGVVDVPETLAEDAPQQEDDPLGYNPQLNCGYDPILRDDRRENKKKLKRRFEHIFEKYERDFEGIGDEIDLKTGEIVVDNGHLQNMQNEHDIGNKAPLEDVQKAAESAEHDVAVSSLEQSDGSGSEHEISDDEDGASDVESVVNGGSDGDFSAVDANADSATSPFDADESALEDDHTNVDSMAPAKGAALLSRGVSELAVPRERSMSATSGFSNSTSSIGSLGATPDNDILDKVPGLRESMLAVQSKYKRGQTMDQDAIQALGMSIANQLATFISRPGKNKSKRKSKNSEDSAWSFPELPEDRARKRRKRSPSPHAELIEPPPSGKKSIWAPIRHPRQQTRRRMKDREPTQPQPQEESDTSHLTEDGVADEHPASGKESGAMRKCANCKSSDSEVWRRGPDGDLCNTCGMYLYRYGLMRPIVSQDEADDPKTPDDTEGEMDPLERDWWLACASANAPERKEVVKPIGVRNSHFVVEEDALIIQLKEIDLLSWETMATYFPGRSAYALQCRYSKKLHGRAPEARNVLIEQGYQGEPNANGIVVFSYTREQFTEEEDELLLKLRDEDGLEWETVASALPGRSPEVLEIRYREISKELLGRATDQPSQNSRQGRASRENSPLSVRCLRYSAEEDAMIVKLREVDKLNWAKIAESIDGRNSFSLQKRYIRELCGKHPNSVLPPRKAYGRAIPALGTMELEGEVSDLGGGGDDPSPEVKASTNPRYSAEEDSLLLELRDTQRLTWEQIDPRMPGRSRTSLIKRYAHILGKRQTQGDPRDGSNALVAMGDISAVDTVIEHDNDGRQTMPDVSEHEQPFTEHEDSLILSLREHESLPWPDIVERLPERTIPSISQRYYQHLLPKKLATTQGAALDGTRLISASPAPSTATAFNTGKFAAPKRWTTEEDDLLVKLRKQGKSWSEIVVHLPGRTAPAAKSHHAWIFDHSRKAYHTRKSLPSMVGAKSQAPLLRQAVNNLRRRSESALPFEGEDSITSHDTGEISNLSSASADTLSPDTLMHAATKQDSGVCVESLSSHSTTTNERMRTLPLALDTIPSKKLREDSHAIQIGQIPDIASPESPNRDSQIVRQSSEPTPAKTAMYATPARYNQQAHPYFVTLPARYPLLDDNQEPVHQVRLDTDAVTKIATSQASAPKAKNNQKATRRQKSNKAQQPRKSNRQIPAVHATETSDEEETTIYDTDDDEFVRNDSAGEDSSECEGNDTSMRDNAENLESTVDESESTKSDIEGGEADELESGDHASDGHTEEKRTIATAISSTQHAPDLSPPVPALPTANQRVRQRSRIQSKNDGPPGLQKRPRKPHSEPKEVTKPKHVARGSRVKDLAASEADDQNLGSDVGILFDKEYVNAHPEETFHHRGKGRWARGPPPSASANRIAIRGSRPRNRPDARNNVRELPKQVNNHDVDLNPSEVESLGASQVQEMLASESMQSTLDAPDDTNEVQQSQKHGGKSTAERPLPSNIQLAATALESKAPEPMLISEIYEYIEGNYDYVRHRKGWRDGIRATLGRCPYFKRASARPNSGWILSGVPVPGTAERAPITPNHGNASREQAALSQLSDVEASGRTGTSDRPSDEVPFDLAQANTSDIAKESQDELETRMTDHEEDEEADDEFLLQQDPSFLSTEADGLLGSSSPPLTKGRSQRHVYGKTSTPGTGSSTLFSHIHKLRSAGRSTPVRASPAVPRIGRMGEIGRGRRIVHTPMRDIDDSEDELAL